MKTKTSIPIFVIGLFSTACTDLSQDMNLLEDSSFQNISINHFVSYADVETIGKAENFETRDGLNEPFEIECITNEANDTLLYVLKSSNGSWKIYSSDTRVPSIVAYSNDVPFDKLMEIEAAKLWINSMAKDMAIIKTLADEKLNFSKEEIAKNEEFWKSVSSPDEFVKNLLQNSSSYEAQTKAVLPTGHYEFAERTQSLVVYDSIPRLTTTNWHQHSNYNKFCPLKSGTSTERAPAGCVAIAAGQMLYFLHYNLGVPTTAPSKAYCNDRVGNIKGDWAQTDYTTTIWNTMNNGLGNDAAPLIADIGRRVGMEYGDEESGASLSNINTKVFQPYQISCSVSDYNSEKLKTSLLNKMPVIVGARGKSLIDSKALAHAFIVDRYQRSAIRITERYVWVYDTATEDDIVPFVPDKFDYSYTSIQINMIGINWGGGEIYNKPGTWYTLTGDWILDNKFNYNDPYIMVYDFKK